MSQVPTVPSQTKDYIAVPASPPDQGISVEESPVVKQPFPPRPNIDHIVTEDDEPVDNIFSEKQQRLLTRALYSSTADLTITKPFLVAANVGIFYGVKEPPIVPDVFLSLGVQVAEDWYAKEHRSYFVWEFGKVPEIVIEVVSNKVGGEAGRKKSRYATIGIPYYVVYDPQKLLSETSLQAYELQGGQYQPLTSAWFAKVGLGLRLWEGEFEGKTSTWLRWVDEAGQLILTGQEQAGIAERRAKSAEEQASQERQAKQEAQQRAKIAEERAAQYLAKLKALGISIEDD